MVATIRDTQNYVHLAAHGCAVDVRPAGSSATWRNGTLLAWVAG